MTTANELIRERVDAFVSDLNELIRQAVLEHVQAALEGSLHGSLSGVPASEPVARSQKSGHPKASTTRTRKRNGAAPHVRPAEPPSQESDPSAQPALALGPSEKLLRILTESGRPMTIRTLALASTLPHNVASDLVQQLAHEGHVTVRRGEVALASTTPASIAHRSAIVDLPPANVHQFVVRRNGERVRRLGNQ